MADSWRDGVPAAHLLGNGWFRRKLTSHGLPGDGC